MLKRTNQYSRAGWGIILVFIIIVVVAVAAGLLFAAQTGRIQLSSVQLPFTTQPIAQTATLSGTISAGPTSPVCRSGQACSRTLANYTLQAKDSNGVIVSTTKTDASGVYTLHLAPGTYVLSTIPKVGIGAVSQPVTVKVGTNHFDVMLDTGLR